MNFLFDTSTAPESDWFYDEETFPNVFTVGFEHARTGQRYQFELSHRRDDMVQLAEFVNWMGAVAMRQIGFNNVGFDYPVLHLIVKMHGAVSVEQIYDKAMSIINAPDNARFANIIWENDRVVEQVDLYKIHHFDNISRATSLKMLEINMGMNNVEDLPFPVGTILNDEQIDVLIDYMWHDIEATKRFYYLTLPQIKFREELSERYGKNFINHNDGKIGKDFFIMKMEEVVPGSCYDRSSGKRVIQQTVRTSVDLNTVIFDYVRFEHPEFQRIMAWFRAQVITKTKGAFSDVNCTIDGFQYDFGLGGIHGSVDSTIIESDDDYQIVDVDVASYYPRIPMATRLKPAHLPDIFCDIYNEVYLERKKYKKGSPENAMYKLALNSVYGDSNNKHSPFFDTAYTMATTVNGQLMLCMLAEQLIKIPGLSMLQVNTDGLTVKCPRGHIEHMRSICTWWEGETQLELEEALYSRMMVRDVNNYIAEYEGGKLKRIGAYAHETAMLNPGTREVTWNKNHSSLVVAKAAQAALVNGEYIDEFIRNHVNIRDFLVNAKVPRSSKLALQRDGQDIIIPNIVRYVVTNNGDPMCKLMPAQGPVGEYKRANKLTDDYFNQVLSEVGLGRWDERIHTKNQSQYEDVRRNSVEAGYLVTICNDIQQLNTLDINYDYYIKKAEKLVLPLRGE